ncbi:MAG: hypothetical protein J0G98_10085 [Terrimonas ferruginea]|uniref:hypothetical protein n=1 Tax=Terrimonas ferruginea TaxID=249 RepID=UPI00092AEC45|nr:hypothetical protein [Terrimonas ferruginea]MBN8783405.1 hypothetical protein [Terrimonas ferruginea]OJW40180.1 MAG: hypothetical protein BGO56_08900 [Sphingobacteriales bacterium 48-107]
MRSILLLLTFLATYTAQAALTPSADTIRPREARPMPSQSQIEDQVHRLKTNAFVLGVAGAAAITTGIILIDNSNNNWDKPNMNIIGGVILLIAGVAFALTSIPLFVVAAHKKRKYLRGDMAFGSEKIDDINMPRMSQASYPTIGFRLRF